MRKQTMLSKLYPNQKFYWTEKLFFGGQFVKKLDDEYLIIEDGADGNSPHEEIRQDTSVWVGDIKPSFALGKEIIDVRNNYVLVIKEIIESEENIFYNGVLNDGTDYNIPSEYALSYYRRLHDN